MTIHRISDGTPLRPAGLAIGEAPLPDDEPTPDSAGQAGAARGGSVETARAERVRRDEDTYLRAMSALAALDPSAIQQYMAAQLRDLQLRTREEGVRTADGAARDQARVREAHYEEAKVAERARQEADLVSAVLKVVATVVAAVVNAIGAIGAVFSGGASLVATIALTVALLGPLIVNGLAQAGVIQDPQVAAGINAAIACVAAVCSFGAGTASAVAAVASAIAAAAPAIMQGLAQSGALDPQTAMAIAAAIAIVASLVSCGAGAGNAVDSASKAATEAARQVLEQVANGARIAQGAVQSAAGGAEIGAAVWRRDRDDRTTDAHEADDRVQVQLDAMEENAGALRDIFRAARRVAAHMEETREGRFEGAHVAANVYARA